MMEDMVRKLRTPLAVAVAVTMLLTVGVSGTFAFPLREGGAPVGNSFNSWTTASDDQGEDTNADEDTDGDSAGDTGDNTGDAGPTTPNHGTCVSAVAMGDTVGGVNANHGGAVSEAAHTTCWTTTDVPPTDTTDTTDTSPTATNHGTCVSGVATSDVVGVDRPNHGGAVSDAAKVTCWTTPDGTSGKHERMGPKKDSGDGNTGTHGKSGEAHGKSGGPHGKSGASHGHGHNA